MGCCQGRAFSIGSEQRTPNGLEICGAPLWGSRPASQAQIAPKADTRLAASVEDPRPFQGASRSEAEGLHRAVGPPSSRGPVAGGRPGFGWRSDSVAGVGVFGRLAPMAPPVIACLRPETLRLESFS